MIRSIALTALLAASAAAQNAPQRADSLHARVDQIFATWNRTDSPGCALGVYRDGRIEYARGYGAANLELGVPLSPQSVLDIGSTSKQFTAMSVMLLAKAGKLSLDDDIRRFIPELPDYGKKITVRHILNHTSGIRDYLTLWTLGGVVPADLTTNGDALALITRQRELNFAPGEQFLYSNSGFFLASVIVERVSKQSLAAFARDNIFVPLGMTHTRFNDDHTAIIPGRATGYSPRRGASGGGLGAFATTMSNFEQVGDGAVQTSIDDLQRWDENFYTGAVGGREVLDAMHTTGILNDGKRQTYALGLMVDDYRGLKSVSHGGSWAGYRAELLRFPEQHLSVACLCNLATTNPSMLARRVAEVYLGGLMKEATVAQAGAGGPRPTPPVRDWTPTAAELTALAGTYYSVEIDATYELKLEGSRLILTARRLPPTPLEPMTKDNFTARGITFRFTRENGQLPTLVVDAGRTRNLRFVKR
jgi:CubicO group peptidase (beta-lactamase class C family)